jgi:uncharacterized protein with HEPN domain
LRSDRERLLDILEAIERIECQATRGYFEIDNELVWSAVKNDLPKLAKQVRSILEEIR